MNKANKPDIIVDVLHRFKDVTPGPGSYFVEEVIQEEISQK